jgi:hypothetical protein
MSLAYAVYGTRMRPPGGILWLADERPEGAEGREDQCCRKPLPVLFDKSAGGFWADSDLDVLEEMGVLWGLLASDDMCARQLKCQSATSRLNRFQLPYPSGGFCSTYHLKLVALWRNIEPLASYLCRHPRS